MKRETFRRRLLRIESLEPRTLLSDGLEAVPAGKMRMENLDRGVIAMNRGSGNVYVGWRLLGTEPTDLAFNVYRSTNGAAAVKRNTTPITTSTNFSDTGVNTTLSNRYFVRPVINGIEQADSASYLMPANEPVRQFLNVPLQIPAGGTTPDGVAYTYNANDASAADLDGDGQYEIILKWDPTNSKDNSQSGYTGNVYVDAYKLDGTMLWRIDLGINIRAGAHYTQFIAYDLDSDGKAEVAMKTAPGTIDGAGNPVLMGSDSASADYRNSSGYILSGPEYLTVFNGITGAAMNTIAFEPARGAVTQWGDSYGNRVDRFTAAVAYLDGERPSLIMGRGYYGPQTSSGQARNEIAAYDFRNGSLTQRWHFKAARNINNNVNLAYVGQGPHGMSVADVDGDGKQEIIYGACAIDDNGTGLYSTGLGHGDAFHVSDLDPSRPGLEVFMVHETPSAYQSNGRNAGGEFRDARTGELLWQIPATNDVGRGVSADIDPNSPGAESWALTDDPNGGTRKIYAANGTPLYDMPSNMFVNFVVWWDGDLTRELLDGGTISEWNNPGRSNFDLDPATAGTQGFAPGASGNNGTKNTPALTADLFGDWREEVVWRRSDNTALMIYTTIIPANNRIYTLMHDPQYRVAVAWQNGAYNQPPHPGFFLGAGMAPAPTPDILLTLQPVSSLQATANGSPSATLTWSAVSGAAYYDVLRSASANGTYNEIATAVTGTQYVDTTVANGATYFYRVVARNSVAASNASAAVSVAVPSGPPRLLAAAFQDEVAPISFTFSFSKNVSASLTSGDLEIIRAGGGTATATLVSYDVVLNRAVFTVPTPLPQGIYTATLNAASITDSGGLTLTGATPLTFHSLPGDMTRDRVVGFDDLLVLAANYNTVGRTYSQGNVNYDTAGRVNFDDLLLLAANYNTTLTASADPPAPLLGLTLPPATAPDSDDDDNDGDSLPPLL
jgi:rhamnogalacturonan endolyase